MVQVKRAYESPEESDGVRVLVDRLWPRGVSKEKIRIEEWRKDLSPSPELCKWFGHNPAKWSEFQARYERELAPRQADLAALRQKAAEGTLTLVYGARDTEHNNAVVLARALASD